MKSKKIIEISKIILKEKYHEFEKNIYLFYDDKKKYTEEIFTNKEIFGDSTDNINIYTVLKNFAVYCNLGVLYYREDIFDKEAEWNRAAEMFDIIFQEILTQEVILEILRKCFFTDRRYSAELFFDFISEVLEANNLKMYFLDDGSELFLFFVLKKDIRIKYRNFSDFLLNNGKKSENLIYSTGK
jgi:hypothetical protein